MAQPLSAYELHIIIKNNYQDFCSDSIGNIQRALKKLVAARFVTVQNLSEHEKGKKIHSITQEGRVSFLQWLNQPIDINKAKNIELARLLLLGFLPREEQIKNIEGQIENLKATYESLLAINHELDKEENTTLAYFQQELDYVKDLRLSLKESDIEKVATDVHKFGRLTLRFGLDSTKFYIDWFENLKNEIKTDIKVGK